MSKTGPAYPTVYAPDREAWRTWLAEHHALEPGALLVYYKKGSEQPSVTYPEAVQEALCFGWIDTTRRALDAARFVQVFVPRRPTSTWSRLNKTYVEELIRAGRMTPAGLRAIEVAQHNGAWHALEAGESLIVPPDLTAALEANPVARGHFEAFPPSVRKYILTWIHAAKRPETRQKRVEQTVQLAAQNIRARGNRP
ncbi:uncharacterized protein YdeI (YjbR/CyaY-like superfamily) [Deinobacterium chartae]|uniref:Uncharacterized protein YdeI (YjbR/CyaY-like superfamily) n=1 Tax=Deinobacterium chartae TaxID=521158 RepID=A0A841I417_9DEIO|nr:YdeI/OmpD-associated family protein [Deinobacterium chartae]MBB6099160.1 uncharacterized protein YdeI (YjbR/CyaY-like superfamily) [Deinobacterium chartae]